MNKEINFSEDEMLNSLLTNINQISDNLYLGNQSAAGFIPSFESE